MDRKKNIHTIKKNQSHDLCSAQRDVIFKTVFSHSKKIIVLSRVVIINKTFSIDGTNSVKN